jgi:pimeloyl-ACP methyl ester carboxylesterase
MEIVWPAAACALLIAAGCGRSTMLTLSGIGGSAPASGSFVTAPGTNPRDNLQQAQQTFAAGASRLDQSDPGATAMFLESAMFAWQAVCETAIVGGPKQEQAGAIYHASLRQAIAASQQFGQFDPDSGLNVPTASGPVRIPVRYHGFAWQPEDFNQWIPVGQYEDERLARKHQRTGWGVPLVIVRHREREERFSTKSLPFAATALLRPTSAAVPGREVADMPHMLELFNPLAVKTIPRDDGQSTPLAADISAPIAWLNENTPHLNFDAFLHPDRQHHSGQLVMLEPYQPGKIPVIFVHGLLSDPLTWNGLINELRASDWFNQRYQVWVFGYSTGRPFLRSAADMRRECREVFAELARDNPDPALQRAVLVGHSMGGLVSKLLITHSDTTLWTSFAQQPLESLETDHTTHAYLSELFFFEPLPFVERAVFIGTPHGGSPIAEEWIGRFASHLVSRAHDFSQEYEAFLRQNREHIHPFFARHIPTSVDMLEPQDPVLQAMRRLPVARQVRLHSVIGNAHRMLVGGPADGVVPVESARHDNVDSELLVPATHQHLQTHPETVQEVLRILMLHVEDAPDPRPAQVGDCREENPRRTVVIGEV